MKVTAGVIENCPNDEYVDKVRAGGVPKHLEFLVNNGFLGNKSGQGYYKKTNERDANGRSIILSLDLEKLEYRPFIKPTLESISNSKKIELLDKRIASVIAEPDKGGQFLRELLVGLMAYASNRIPEISDHIYSLDNAMKAG